MPRKVLYPEVTVEILSGQSALTVERAKELLGWESVGPDDDKFEKWGTDFLFRDLHGNKVRLTRNKTNRPFRMGLAKDYANEMLRNKWHLNGENMVFDRFGDAQSAQHRLVGLVLASQELELNKEKWSKYNHRGGVKIPAMLCFGISDKDEVADSLDKGQKRTLGDVIFRRHEFEGDFDPKRISNTLAGAIKLVWTRMGGKKVSNAPKLYHSEALDVLEKHPALKDCVVKIFELEGGKGVDGKNITKIGSLSLPVAAGLMYLMATCDSDRESGEISTKKMAKATKFWTLLAEGAGMEKDHPVLILRNLLMRLEASSAFERDRIQHAIVKAWNAFADGHAATLKDIKVQEGVDKESGRKYFKEDPKIGGLDVVVEDPVIDSVGGWNLEDLCWVEDETGDWGGHWFGSIAAFIDMETAEVYSKEDDDTFEVAISSLRADEPEDEVVEEDEEEVEAETEEEYVEV